MYRNIFYLKGPWLPWPHAGYYPANRASEYVIRKVLGLKILVLIATVQLTIVKVARTISLGVLLLFVLVQGAGLIKR